MNDPIIKHMVDRFLTWKLPEDFHPDGGISFEPEFNAEYMAQQGEPPMRHEPVGTNLLTAIQAEAMVRYILEDKELLAASKAYLRENVELWLLRLHNEPSKWTVAQAMSALL